MRIDKLTVFAFNKGNEQLKNMSIQAVPKVQIPTVINIDTLLVGDFSRIEVDCSLNDVTLTLKDASQIGDFGWVIHRSDNSNFDLKVVAEITAQAIQNQTEIFIYPFETYVIHAEQIKYTIN